MHSRVKHPEADSALAVLRIVEHDMVDVLVGHRLVREPLRQPYRVFARAKIGLVGCTTHCSVLVEKVSMADRDTAAIANAGLYHRGAAADLAHDHEVERLRVSNH